MHTVCLYRKITNSNFDIKIVIKRIKRKPNVSHSKRKNSKYSVDGT